MEIGFDSNSVLESVRTLICSRCCSIVTYLCIRQVVHQWQLFHNLQHVSIFTLDTNIFTLHSYKVTLIVCFPPYSAITAYFLTILLSFVVVKNSI